MATGTSWEVWNYGRPVAQMSDIEVQIFARRAWDICDGEELRRFRAEAKRRGIEVV